MRVGCDNLTIVNRCQGNLKVPKNAHHSDILLYDAFDGCYMSYQSLLNSFMSMDTMMKTMLTKHSLGMRS